MTINVTQSSMPDFDEYCRLIKSIWNNKQLTNNGPLHSELEGKISNYLKVENASLLTNGHIALEIALEMLEKKGEIITTPYTFASTTHAIMRAGFKPIFCDIDEDTFTIDSNKIEELITENTVAILPVHVYGNICDVEKINEIAKKHKLHVIYDAAHAFGVEYKGRGIGTFGDFSMFSFHATKVFNTVEGGALTYSNPNIHKKIDILKNFGIVSQDEIDIVAGNAKMDEFRAAMGLLNLKNIDENIEKRRKVFERYQNNLLGTKGIKTISYREGVKPNYAYYPVVFDKNRDEVFNLLKQNGINARKYFYPAINETKAYSSISKQDTPVSSYVSKNVLCLPMYSNLELETVDKICDLILR